MIDIYFFYFEITFTLLNHSWRFYQLSYDITIYYKSRKINLNLSKVDMIVTQKYV